MCVNKFYGNFYGGTYLNLSNIPLNSISSCTRLDSDFRIVVYVNIDKSDCFEMASSGVTLSNGPICCEDREHVMYVTPFSKPYEIFLDDPLFSRAVLCR